MHIIVHCIGKVKDKEMQILINEYLKRLKSEFAFKELPACKGTDVAYVKKTESQALLNSAKDGFKICLDEKGEKLNSLEFAILLKKVTEFNNKVHFFIGGAHGHDKSILEEADRNISLSNLTFPHQMVRLILVEQVYRAYCINNNHPYHKI